MELLKNTATALEKQLAAKQVNKLTKAEAIEILNAVLNAVKKDAEEHNDEINENSTLQTVMNQLIDCKNGQEISDMWENTSWIARKSAGALASGFLPDKDDKNTVKTLITIMNKSL